ncbi:hypothetical protein BB559_001931 [Furculomyces boomerangus]|uniref:Ribosome production factor 2 homolog n=1 Tax=Furculomyces boomerangus TaxID=61424 RepID=A0A2T9YZN5_9FUNG|nr:hypothetical protein BB559_001931 [Furculomyces boomerangus]
MLPTIKPKTARSKRALEKREPKVIENPKKTLVVRGSQTSLVIQNLLKDLLSIKKPLVVNLSKRNEIHPFDDETKIEFLGTKNDASLFTIGSHSKKRPNNLVIGRLFDHKLFDMFEFEVSNFLSIEQIKGPTCSAGIKPLIVFAGEHFTLNPALTKLKNLFTDFFQGEKADAVCLTGLEHVISITVELIDPKNTTLTFTEDLSNYKFYFRSYHTSLLKSGQKLPRVELENMGPFFDLVVRRYKTASDEAWKLSTRIPKELFIKKTKNISHDEFGNKLGRVHVGTQDIQKIQTRKVKALKKKPLHTIE